MIAQLDGDYLRTARTRTITRLVSYGLFEGRPAMTRGQWVNPLVLRHLELAASLAPRRRVDRPVFVLGIGRSGTTLLGRLLSVHPDVGFLNEPKAVWNVVCPFEDISGFYNKGPARVRLGADDATPAVQAAARALFGHYCWMTRSARLVDKYPELTYRRAFLRAIFPDAVLVAIVRRPSAVVRSITRFSDDHRDGDDDWWGVRSRKWQVLWDEMVEAVPRRRALLGHVDPRSASPRQRAITEWVVAMDELTRATEDPGERLDLVLRYEDLVARPVESITGLLGATGLAPSARVEEFARRAVRPERPAPPETTSEWGDLQPEVDRLLGLLGYGP